MQLPLFQSFSRCEPANVCSSVLLSLGLLCCQHPLVDCVLLLPVPFCCHYPSDACAPMLPVPFCCQDMFGLLLCVLYIWCDRYIRCVHLTMYTLCVHLTIHNLGIRWFKVNSADCCKCELGWFRRTLSFCLRLSLRRATKTTCQTKAVLFSSWLQRVLWAFFMSTYLLVYLPPHTAANRQKLGGGHERSRVSNILL